MRFRTWQQIKTYLEQHPEDRPRFTFIRTDQDGNYLSQRGEKFSPWGIPRKTYANRHEWNVDYHYIHFFRFPPKCLSDEEKREWMLNYYREMYRAYLESGHDPNRSAQLIALRKLAEEAKDPEISPWASA